MKSVAFGAVALALLVAPGAATTPISKVLEMLSDLQSRVIGEGSASHKVFAEFSEWCEDQARELGFSIKTAQGEIASLKATIEKEASNIEGYNTKIEELAAELALDEADLKAATEIRAKEEADFSAEEKELMEVIDTLARATAILEREMSKIGSASMLQLKNAKSLTQALGAMVQASLLSSTDASKLTALLQSMQGSADQDDDTGAPDAAVYQGHADGMGRQQDGGIIQVLKDLSEKASTQLDGLRKAETSSLQTFQVLAQNLKDEIKNGNTDLAQAKKDLATSGSLKAEAEGDLSATSADLASDEDTKAELHADCMEKAETFEAEQKSRGEELKALAEAKKVLQDTTSGAESQTYSFVQLGASTGVDQARLQALRFVQGLAQKQNSKSLAQLAMQMASVIRVTDSSGEDPFAKIKGLIADMISKLEDEAAADADHKAYCDKELKENEEKEADKIAEIEKLTAKIDEWTARSSQLKAEVAELQSALAALAKSQATMDKIREDEKALYDANRPELEKGLEGVKVALKVLKDYYSQTDKAHVAAEGTGASVIGLLEVIESDFSKNLAEMISTEEAAAAEYEAESKQNAVDKTNKDQDVKYKTQEAANRDKETAEGKTDRAGVQKELDAVQAVLKSLHSQCDETVTPYEELKRRREMEIAGLKQALEILEGEAVLLQQRSSRLRAVRRHTVA
jgi:cell division protein FtsL